MSKTKTELLDLLASNRVQELCDALQAQLVRTSPTGEIALLEGQWNALADYARTGSMSWEQASIEQAKIRQRLADFIEKMEREGQLAGGESVAKKGFSTAGLIGFGLAFALAFGAFLLFRNRGEKTEMPQNASKTTEKAPISSESAGSALQKTRQIKSPLSHFRLKSPLVGEIAVSVASLILRPYNSSFSEFEAAFLIRPEAEKSLALQPGAFAVLNGAEVLPPEKVEPNFIDVGKSATVRATFLIPKNWPKARLRIRHGVVPPIAEEFLELDLN